MIQETKKLHEDRARALTGARAINDLALKEKRELTPEQETEFNKFMDEASALKKTIDRTEKLHELSPEDKQEFIPASGKSKKETPEEKEEREAAEKIVMNRAMRSLPMVNDEQKALFSKINKRAQSVGTDTAGGFLVFTQFADQIEKALKLFGGMRQVAKVVKHEKGGTFNQPMLNNTGRTGRWLAENTTVTKTDLAFTNVTLSDYTASSDLIPVSLRLFEDESYDLTGLITESLAECLGRLTNLAYTTGAGSTKPTGVSVGSVEGKVSALSTAITFDELSDLKFSLDPAYRTLATWMFNDATLKAISKLKDGDSRYLWNPNIQVGVPDLLLGNPYVINQDVASIGVNAKCIYFGDFKKYLIRDVGGFGLTRLNERYADDLQVAFMLHMRTDGKVLNAGTDPIKHMRNPNT